MLGARAGLAADPSGGAAQGMHNIHEFVAVYLVRVSQESLRSPSDLFAVRSLKQSSDVFAYLKIRERRGDEREELVQGKGCPADPRKGAPAEIPSKLQKKPKSVIFNPFLFILGLLLPFFSFFPLMIFVVFPPGARGRAGAAGASGGILAAPALSAPRVPEPACGTARDEQGARLQSWSQLDGAGDKCWWLRLDCHTLNPGTPDGHCSDATSSPRFAAEFLCVLPSFQVQFSHPASGQG